MTQVLARYALAAGALALAAGAATVRLTAVDYAADAGAALVDPARADEALGLAREALRRDSGNAYRWADMADALAAAGEVEQARPFMDRAVALAPAVPPLLIRHVNFAVMHDEPGAALRTAARVLAIVPDYDGVLFNYFDWLATPAEVASAVEHEPRALRTWFAHAVRGNQAEAVKVAWQRASASGAADEAMVAAYVDHQVRAGAWTEAEHTWATWLGNRKGDYPAANRVFNGRFTEVPTGAVLDWRLQSEPGRFTTTHEQGAVRIEFFGKENVSYDHLSQVAVLDRAGRYTLSARVKTDDLTTNEGVRLAVTDLGLATEPLTGTHDWQEVALELHVDAPRTVRVAIVRKPSRKIESKIAGTAWVSDIRLILTTQH